MILIPLYAVPVLKLAGNPTAALPGTHDTPTA